MTQTLFQPTATIDRDEARGLALTAYERFADTVAGLDDAQWSLPTDCDAWDVRALVGHVVGAMRAAASMRENFSQQREIKQRMKRDGGSMVDTMTQVQIDRTADLTHAELVAECRSLCGPATNGRFRTPAPMRRFVKIPVVMPPIDETWRLGYLLDTILTRDAWLHRIDLCRAIGSEPQLTADHDGRIIADVVAEWARRHGKPFDLTLTGPAGGVFGTGSGDRLELDAVEFCRIVSARAEGTGLLAEFVPF